MILLPKSHDPLEIHSEVLVDEMLRQLRFPVRQKGGDRWEERGNKTGPELIAVEAGKWDVEVHRTILLLLCNFGIIEC